MTQKSCAVGMRNAKLGNHLKVHELLSRSEVDTEDVEEAVRHKMDGPRQLLDYCSMQQKVRYHHSILFCVEAFANHEIAMVFIRLPVTVSNRLNAPSQNC